MYLCKETTSVKKSETEQVTAVPKDEEEDKVQTAVLSSPSADEVNLDFVKYTCDTRKTAMKEGNIITISSVTQSRVRIDGFTSGRNMSGTVSRQHWLTNFLETLQSWKKKLTVLHITINRIRINWSFWISDHLPLPWVNINTSHLRQNCDLRGRGRWLVTQKRQLILIWYY